MAFLFFTRQNPCHLIHVTVQPIFIFHHLYECQVTEVNLNGFEGARWFVGSDVLQVVDVGSDRLPQTLTTTYGGFIRKALLVRLNQPLPWSWSFQSATEFLPDSKGEMESNGLSVHYGKAKINAHPTSVFHFFQLCTITNVFFFKCRCSILFASFTLINETTNVMQLGAIVFIITGIALYMFRVLFAPIIRSPLKLYMQLLVQSCVVRVPSRLRIIF